MADEPDDGRDRIQELLRRYSEGDRSALNELIPLIEGELRRMARRMMNGQQNGHTLQATALVNEAYIKLARQSESPDLKSPLHLMALLAQAMRHVLVDHAKGKQTLRRNGGERVPFDFLVEGLETDQVDLLTLDEALTALERHDPLLARLVELRYFAGSTMAEIAEILGRKLSALDHDWRFARAWLRRHLRKSYPERDGQEREQDGSGGGDGP